MSTTTIQPDRHAAMPTSYRAAVVHEFGSPLSVETVPAVGLTPGQVRVKVEATGLCHTDIHAAHGDWPVKPSPPFVPGHEGVGIVVELGPGVTEVALGDRVAMPWLGYACGTCDHCVSGWETLCLEQKNMGYSFDGAFGEYATAYARYVVKVPAGVDPFDAAPLTCAGVTTYKAVKVAGTRSSDLVAVFGVGGLGHLAIQYAAIAGGRVIAVDIHDEKLTLARELGRGVHDQRARGGSDRGDPEARRRRPGDRARGRAEGVRAGLRLAAPRRHARLRRAAGGQRGQAADLRDGPERDHDRRLDRRHARRAARRLRAARGGQDDGHPRDALARRRQRRDRRRRGRPRRRPHRARALTPPANRRHPLASMIDPAALTGA